MRVRFLRDFDWPPTGPWHTAYKADPQPITVKRECGEAAVEAGAAEEVDGPNRREAPDGVEASDRG